MAQCATTALAGAVPRPCVRGARGWFGGFGPVPGVVSLPFPPSRPACPALLVACRPVRVSLTLARWYATPRGLCVPRALSGCPSGSPRMPFACVCARAPAASAPPPLGGVACAPRAVPAVPLRVSCPGPLLRPACFGGRRSGFGSPLLGLRLWGWRKGVPGGGDFHCCEGRLGSGIPPPPTARPLGGLLGPATHVLWARACGCGGPTGPLGLHALWGLRAPGVVGGRPPTCLGAMLPPWGGSVAFVCRGTGRAGGGEGRPVRRAPRLCGQGGACGAGGRSASFRPPAFPGQATKRVSLASFWSPGAWPPIPLRFVLPRLHWARSVRGSGALARACLFPAFPVGAGGSGGGAGRAPAPLSGAGRGDHPPCLGGPGAGAPAACGPVGGGRAAAYLLPLWVAARGSLPWPPYCRRRTPPLACAFGRGRGAGLAWGGMRGGPWTASPGASSDLNPPTALPEWAMVMAGPWGARPPYCSGASPCAVPRLSPRAAPARWFGLARWPRPLREQAARGAGARGVQVQPHPPPRVAVPSGGGGASPWLRGGGRSLLWPSTLGGGAGGGMGGLPHHPPPPRPVRRRPAICCLRRALPGYTRAVGIAGRPRASGAARSAANGSVRRGWGGGGAALVRAPVFSRPAGVGLCFACTPFFSGLGVVARGLLRALRPFSAIFWWGCLWRRGVLGLLWVGFAPPPPPFFFRAAVGLCCFRPCHVVALWCPALCVPILGLLVSVTLSPFV